MKTMKRIESSQNRPQITKIIGVSFVTMLFFGLFAELVVRNRLIDWGDPEQTVMLIRQSLALFSAGVLAWLIVIMLDVVIAVAFHQLLSRQGKLSALLMVSFRLLYVAIKGAAIIGLLLARELCALPPDNAANATQSLAYWVMQYLTMHRLGFAIALLPFGVHLILLAGLLYRDGRVPKWLVGGLVAGGIGYSLNSLVTLLGGQDTLISAVVIALFILPMTFSELLVGLWLWLKPKTVAA